MMRPRWAPLDVQPPWTSPPPPPPYAVHEDAGGRTADAGNSHTAGAQQGGGVASELFVMAAGWSQVESERCITQAHHGASGYAVGNEGE